MPPNGPLLQFETSHETTRAYPTRRVDQLIEETAAYAPNRVAITFGDTSITYQELCQQTNLLAMRLQKIGVRPGSIVGICMDRSIQLVVALCAVLKAGGAYLPLDPGLPEERLKFMCEDAQPHVIVVEFALKQQLPSDATNILILEENTPVSQASTTDTTESLCSESGLRDAAYLLYTSGTTGKPKGVKVSHGALTNVVSSLSADMNLNCADILLATATISFDISAFEIFAPLVAGAHLLMASRNVSSDGVLLADAIRSSGATILQATPSGWRVLLESGWRGAGKLRILSAGEPLDRSLLVRLMDRGSEVWNLYGPTETTIYATARRYVKEQMAGKLVPVSVGKPLANYTAYVLDERQERVLPGMTGELYVGGAGTADGYLNRPGLTAAKFIPDPFSLDGGSRLFRTGDFARFLENGELECLGRLDNQIKLRGHRIELEEIEASLESHPLVQQAIIKVSGIRQDDQRLIAYLVTESEQGFDVQDLRQHATRLLPSYMVPAAFVRVESFALTPSGKVDRNALPAPALAGLEPADGCSVSPSFEEEIARSWKFALNLSEIGPADDFYQLGGHSLLAMRMVAEVERKLRRQIPVSWLIESPTLLGFTERVKTCSACEASCLVRMQAEGDLAPIYFIHHRLGDILVYRSLAECLSPKRPVYGIQAPVNFADRPQPYSLSALADEYLREILSRPAPAIFHLAGYSSGGVFAFEMARQLTAAGYKIGLLALIDSDIQGFKSDGHWFLRKAWKILVRKLCKIVFKFEDELAQGLKSFLMDRFRHYRLLWRMHRAKQASQPHKGDLTLEEAIFLSETAYRPEAYAGRALLVRFRNEAWKLGPNPLMGWQDLIKGGISAYDLPGGHLSGMSPARARQIALILQAEMQQLENEPGAGTLDLQTRLA